MIQYCENEAANLILSSFAGRAEAEGIVMKVEGGMKAKAVISDTDLCVLLSNAWKMPSMPAGKYKKREKKPE